MSAHLCDISVMDMDERQSPLQTSPSEVGKINSDLLTRPSSLPEISAEMRGFASEQEAREVGGVLLGLLRVFGTFLNLEKLIAVTVAFNYDQALAEIHHGFPSNKKLTKTQDDFATGVAMAATVLQDGKPFSHLVINAAVVYPLREESEGADAKLAMYVLAHEAAHIHDLAMQERAFPGLYGTRVSDYKEGILFGVAHQCWEEYIACRLSAHFGDEPERIRHFEDPFCASLESARDRGNAAIIAYRTHADVGKLVSELVDIHGRLLVFGAYLLGHLDGLDKNLQEAAPRASELIQKADYFRPLFLRLGSELKAINAEYGKWTSLDVFDNIKRVVEELLNSAGISFAKLPTGSYWIDVPFTYATLPKS